MSRSSMIGRGRCCGRRTMRSRRPCVWSVAHVTFRSRPSSDDNERATRVDEERPQRISRSCQHASFIRRCKSNRRRRLAIHRRRSSRAACSSSLKPSDTHDGHAERQSASSRGGRRPWRQQIRCGGVVGDRLQNTAVCRLRVT